MALGGRYFAVLHMMPKDFPAAVHLERDALSEACEGLLADNEAPYPVMLNVSPTTIRVAARSPDLGEAQEELRAVPITAGRRAGPVVRLRAASRALTHPSRTGSPPYAPPAREDRPDLVRRPPSALGGAALAAWWRAGV